MNSTKIMNNVPSAKTKKGTSLKKEAAKDWEKGLRGRNVKILFFPSVTTLQKKQ